MYIQIIRESIAKMRRESIYKKVRKYCKSDYNAWVEVTSRLSKEFQCGIDGGRIVKNAGI